MDEHTDDLRASRYVIYVRKSTDDPQKQVRSIDDQISECEELAKRLDLHVIGKPIRDDKSAKKPNRREKFKEMIERGEINGIVAWHPDRLARNMMEGGQIIQLIDDGKLLDLKFVSFPFTNDANGKMMLGISFALSKHYSDKLSADVRRGNMNALKEGKSSGSYKAGYLRDNETGFYHPEPVNFAIMQKAWQMRLEGARESRIVTEINVDGYRRVLKGKTVRQRREQEMTMQKLNSYFTDPIYYGILEQRGQPIDLTELYEFETMVTKEEWERVQRMKRSHGKEKVKYDFPFRDIVYCAECKKLRTIGASRGRGKKQIKKVYYRCDTKGCPERGKSVRGLPVSEAISGLIHSIQIEKIDKAELAIALTASIAMMQKGIASQLKDLKTKRTKAETELKDMAKRKIKQTFTKNEQTAYEEETERLRKVIDGYDTQIKPLEATRLFSSVDVEGFLNTLKVASEDYDEVTHDVKDTIAKIFILNLFVAKGDVASISLKTPFDEFILHPLVLNGGRGWS